MRVYQNERYKIMKKLLFAALLFAASVSVTPVANAFPEQSPCPLTAHACVGPGNNQHCNSFLDNSGNNNTALYTACCHDVLLSGSGVPC